MAAVGSCRGADFFIFIHRHKETRHCRNFFLGEIEDKGVGHDSFSASFSLILAEAAKYFTRVPDLLKFLQM